MNRESLKADLKKLHAYPVGSVQIHGHRVIYMAPELIDVFLDHLKERENIARQELKNIEYMRGSFVEGHRAMMADRLKTKHGK